MSARRRSFAGYSIPKRTFAMRPCGVRTVMPVAWANCFCSASHTYRNPTAFVRAAIEAASEKKRTAMAQYGRKSGPGGWHFLQGDAASIAALTKAVGFRYVWDAEQKQFAHATGITVLTPQGR